MEIDIILFYYYSAPSLPDNCYLNLVNDLLYRNMFLFLTPGNGIHFEFPIFEDHSYNTICNRVGMRSLIKRPAENERYIIFRTKNLDNKKNTIIGYYKVGRKYYQETNMFGNNGFVWGIESEDVHLIRKGQIELEEVLRQGYRTSWNSEEWNYKLNELLERIRREEDISDLYRDETNRLIRIFKDREAVIEWREECQYCTQRGDCTLFRRYMRYNNGHKDSDMYCVLHKIYCSNIYSRNYLNTIPKIYIR
ncbi:MAG: hypothetical protein ACTSRG_19855 [Candidatus Helarchaeota archaeon]